MANAGVTNKKANNLSLGLHLYMSLLVVKSKAYCLHFKPQLVLELLVTE